MSGGRWTVCDIAEDFYSALKKEGVELTPQQVLDIQALSLDAMGDFEDGTRIHGAPVVVGGAAFWPITIAASMWRATRGRGEDGGYNFFKVTVEMR